eukprot:TRINITY_DN10056_c0_g1_i2.p1 TRINITY_DN10056_c0_g1~~TRINITY_DN10056_c0_g1_i2.p1  ORF type:complete len:797 (-),score=143.12 TRINITY_DN10056_c0_g1_i2:99-2489(-)
MAMCALAIRSRCFLRLLLIALCLALLGSPQQVPEYNLWVCPHCERGVKAAEVTDLSCEVGAAAGGDGSGPHWPSVKRALYVFLRSLDRPAEQRDSPELRALLQLIQAPIQGECYLGTMALGFFSYNFMDPAERREFVRTTVFGGVPFQRAIPLSYWDIYLSGWPIFGLLAAAGSTLQHDAEASPSLAAGSSAPWVGMTGISLEPRECCDFPGGVSEHDKSFMRLLSDNLGSFGWVSGGDPISMAKPLRYLAETAQRNCSWGRATSYFVLAEALLAAPGGISGAVLNSTRNLMTLGEHNLDRCMENTTVYHLMMSLWPFWHVLGRMEMHRHRSGKQVRANEGPQGSLPSAAAAAVAAGASANVAAASVDYRPPALPPDAVQQKWQHFATTRQWSQLTSGSAAQRASGREGAAKAPVLAESCLESGGGNAHVALSADIAQIDGLIVTLNSAAINAGENASRLCFHVFALPRQRAFVTEALSCAFGANLTALGSSSEGAGSNGAATASPLAYLLRGRARLLVHSLEPSQVWNEIGLPAAPRAAAAPSSAAEAVGVESAPDAEASAPDAVELGDAEIRGALKSDTGNLGAVHNFVRFVLHSLLPALPRVVYLDVDLVVRGDLTQLYDTPLLAASPGNGSAATIAVVRRTHQPLRVYVDVLQPAVPSWVPSEAPSFNAGVLVIDLERWRARRASSLVAEWISANRQRRLWNGGSQPPLLLLFYDDVAALDFGWNIDGLGHRLNYPKDVLRQAKVLHWTGPLKPWRHHGVNRFLWEPYLLEYCPAYSFREHTTTCRPDSWFC